MSGAPLKAAIALATMAGAVAMTLATSCASASRAAEPDSFSIGVHQTDGTAAPSSGNVASRMVLLVHGLDEPGTIWLKLIPVLQSDGLKVAEFRYPNDGGIAATAQLLAAELQRLRKLGVEDLHLVAHSMGGLVCRELLTTPTIARDTLPKVQRLIMVATPNHGSELARFRFAAEAREHLIRMFQGPRAWSDAWTDGHGEAGDDLLPDSRFLAELNARALPKDVRLSIIAGDESPMRSAGIVNALDWMRGQLHVDEATLKHWRQGFDAVSNGKGDGVVSLESAKLAGVDDIVVVHGHHISLLEGAGKSEPAAIAPIRERLLEP